MDFEYDKSSPYNVTDSPYYRCLRRVTTRPIPILFHEYDCGMTNCTFVEHSIPTITRRELPFCFSENSRRPFGTYRFTLAYREDGIYFYFMDDDDYDFTWFRDYTNGIDLYECDWLIEHFDKMGLFDFKHLCDFFLDGIRGRYS